MACFSLFKALHTHRNDSTPLLSPPFLSAPQTAWRTRRWFMVGEGGQALVCNGKGGVQEWVIYGQQLTSWQTTRGRREADANSCTGSVYLHILYAEHRFLGFKQVVPPHTKLTPLVVLLPADGFQWGCDRGSDSLRKRTGPREGRQADEGWSNELRKNFLERDRKMMFTKNILSLLEKQSLPENRLWLN